MPELYLKIEELVKAGNMEEAGKIQYAANEIIYAMCACHGNLYGVIKAILKIREGLDLGGVRKPLPALIPEDMEQVEKCAAMIDKALYMIDYHISTQGGRHEERRIISKNQGENYRILPGSAGGTSVCGGEIHYVSDGAGCEAGGNSGDPYQQHP